MSNERSPRSLVAYLGFGALAVAAAIVAGATAADAHSYTLGDIAIGHVWAPPSDGTKSIAVYGPIFNQGSETVTLEAVSSPVAGVGKFRKDDDGNVSWPEAIDFPPGKPIALAPWREHVWLTDLDRPLKAGDSFDLDLDFGTAGHITVEVEVEKKPGH